MLKNQIFKKTMTKDERILVIVIPNLIGNHGVLMNAVELTKTYE